MLNIVHCTPAPIKFLYEKGKKQKAKQINMTTAENRTWYRFFRHVFSFVWLFCSRRLFSRFRFDCLLLHFTFHSVFLNSYWIVPMKRNAMWWREKHKTMQRMKEMETDRPYQNWIHGTVWNCDSRCESITFSHAHCIPYNAKVCTK